MPLPSETGFKAQEHTDVLPNTNNDVGNVTNRGQIWGKVSGVDVGLIKGIFLNR